jgi:hypothetical protein
MLVFAFVDGLEFVALLRVTLREGLIFLGMSAVQGRC